MTTTIPLKKDEDPDMTIWMCEQCCSCGKRTRWWTDLPDRTSGEQVALCLYCAPWVNEKDIPSKRAWWDGARMKGMVAADRNSLPALHVRHAETRSTTEPYSRMTLKNQAPTNKAERTNGTR